MVDGRSDFTAKSTERDFQEGLGVDNVRKEGP